MQILSLKYQCFFIVFSYLLASSVLAHEGHRFIVMVEDGKLMAQGVNTESPTRFNEKPVRPYVNVIHDHWTNYGFNGVDTAISYLPGFDVLPDEQKLWHSALDLRLNRIYRWQQPPESPDAATKPVFITPIAAEFQLILGQNRISTLTGLPDTIQLVKYIPKSGALDLDLRYELQQRVTDSIDVIEAQLSTSAEGVADSDTVYIILGPPGYRYQKALIFLEQYLSVNQPEVIVRPLPEKSSLAAFVKANLVAILALLSIAVVFVLWFVSWLQRQKKSPGDMS